MKILIPYDAATTGMKNPFLFLLMRELVKSGRISSVQHGYGWLYEPGHWDLIHLHWPELLVKSRLADMSRTDLLESQDFDKVIHALQQKKEAGTGILLTVHNERPHKDQEGRFSDFYDEVVSLSDGLIHLGTASDQLMKNKYPKMLKDKASFVIPHGNYEWFPNEKPREECRRMLNLHPDVKLVLAFGAIRSRRELELGIDAFNMAGIENGVYMMAGKLPFPYKSQPRHFIERRKLYRYRFDSTIRTEERVIPPQDVQIYLNAADLLLIPRYNTLNSGNVALGFTFGKVVAGPDYGVIGETLKETGNPVFNPYEVDSVADAIQRGLKRVKDGLGRQNQIYAKEKMGWEEIGRMSVEAYQSVLDKE